MQVFFQNGDLEFQKTELKVASAPSPSQLLMAHPTLGTVVPQNFFPIKMTAEDVKEITYMPFSILERPGKNAGPLWLDEG